MIDIIIEIGFGTKAPWSIRSLEPDYYFELEGQFPPQDFQYSYNANYAQTGMLSKSDPVTTFINKSADKMSFKGILWSDFNMYGLIVDDITQKLAILDACIRPLTELMRPPLICFEYGEDYYIEGFATDISDIRHDVYKDGILQGVSFNFSMIRAGTYELTTGAPGQFFRETRYVTPKHDDTYEMIAYQEYGDPMLGIKLQQLNYEYPQASDAMSIKVLEKTHPKMLGEIQPTSLQLSQGTDFDERLAEILLARSGSKKVYT